MDELLLSVIIPAYNAETSITGTVQSIYREFQTSIPYEIIVVENGATDQTTQVVEKLAVQMTCVKLYHSEKGVSNARNTGIANAAGKWLMFVDADDELHLGCGKRIIDIMQNSEADLCLFGHMNGEETRLVCEKTEVFNGKNVEQARIRLLEAPTRYMQVWSKLFRRQRIVDAGIQFEPKLRFSEDSDFTFQYTACCHMITFYADILYDYHINAASVMHTFDEKKLDGYVQAMRIMEKRLAGESAAVQQAGQQYILAHFHIAMVNSVFSTDYLGSFSNKVGMIKQTARKTVFRKAIRGVSLKSGGMVSRVTAFLLKGHLYGVLGLVYAFRGWQKRS